jgi:G3E family GTPase
VFGDLIATLNRLYHARAAGEAPAFDRVIIETSGLADPRPVVQAFLSDPTLEGLYRLDSVLAVVDAINGPATLLHHDEAAQQIALAERIVITKLDLLGTEQTRAREADLREHFRSISPAATVYRNDTPGLDSVEILLAGKYSLRRDEDDPMAWLNAQAYPVAVQADGGRAVQATVLPPPRSNEAEHLPGTWAAAAAEPAAHLHRHVGLEIASFCLVRAEPTTLYGLELLLAAVEHNLGPGLLRLKGLVHVKERPEQPAVIHGAQHLLHNLSWLERWPTADRSTRIVFITKSIARSELVEMVALLDRIAQRTALARDRAATHSAGV